MLKKLFLLLVIIQFFSCTSTTKDSEEQTSNELNQNMNTIQPNSKINKLNATIIDTTQDEELLAVVFDNLISKLPQDFSKEFETVMSWNRYRQAIYMIWVLEAEVNNGGYNQFYFNSSRVFYKYLPEALQFVGANKFADLTEKANQTYESEYNQITAEQDGTLEGFMDSYEDNPLNEFDDKFYELYEFEDITKIQADFIRKNKIQFIDE